MRGKAWKFRDDVNTDEIIPARYLNTSDPKELARHCMEDIDPQFMEKMSPGDIIVAGKNFGCGSSREHAPVAIKAAGVSCVIAESFARIFYRNAVNIGLPIMEAKEGAQRIREGDMIRVEPEEGKIINETTGEEYQVAPFPPFMQAIIAQGGLINYVRARVQESR
ncbi:MAG: 3-isopropylmalate dehydratase small subunit [Limnochordia bacterium]|jgi:3-isopropylmalate/(R)-2-methylmalate dehydratase small subunit|nr:3-isopropylmalate dehydratase small subunit [Bacillota bacterium]